MHLRLTLILAACTALATACGAPMAGSWHGTFDHGPVQAHAVTLHVQEDGQKGWIELREPGKSFAKYTICQLDVDPNRTVTLVYDANRPNCDTGTENKDPSERRTWKGMVGESVFYGDVVNGTNALGFFRFFRDADVAPTPGDTAAEPVPAAK